jgi:Lon protease-like protein
MSRPKLNLPKKLVVPVFPLPNAILFPRARLPLYIFEPRYRQMVDEALQSDRYISVTLLQEQDKDMVTTADICGLGQITDVERLPKDEKNIVLTGLVRVRLLKQVTTEPYIKAEVARLSEKQPTPAKHEILFGRMRDAVKEWLFRMRTGNIRQLAELGGCRTTSELCDFFGAYLLDDQVTRQKLLSELNVAKRAALIMDLVKTELYRYSAPFEN